MSEFKRLPASDVGLRAPRGCTNLCGVVFFAAFWALMIFIGITSYRLGDLDRLIYGVDYLGNVCGKGSPGDLMNLDGVPWSSRTSLWYPVTFDPATQSFQIIEARKMGVCVAQCPTTLEAVNVYYPSGSSPPTPYGFYVSLFDSDSKFNRCVPDLKSFFCQDVTNCKNQSNFVTANIGELYDGLTEGFNGLAKGWWILLVCAIIAIVVCFVWMFVLRRLVKPMVVLTMTILVVVLGAGGYVLYHMHTEGGSSSNYYLGGAIAAWVVDFLLLCVILFVRKDVMIACDIIEEAAKIPTSLPTMMLVPPVASVLMLPFAFFFLFTSATIYTAANTINVTASVPIFNDPNSTSPNGYAGFESKEYAVENWRIYAEIYNLLMFLWSVGFVNAIAYMIVAFCAVFWYWSNPGDDKKPEAGTCTAAGLTIKNHLGTLAIGSFIVAVLQVLRILLSLLEKRLQAYAGKSDAVKCCLYCAECLLACFHRVVKFINKNAYIMTAMTGEPFLDAARHALHLLLGNALSVAAISVIGEWICLFGKVLITAITLVICYFMAGGTDSDHNVVLLMVVVGLSTYFITCVFINVFHVCIDTVLLSYCYDLSEHDGGSKPYYFPSDLAKHVERARERMKTTEGERALVSQNEQPLNKQV